MKIRKPGLRFLLGTIAIMVIVGFGLTYADAVKKRTLLIEEYAYSERELALLKPHERNGVWSFSHPKQVSFQQQPSKWVRDKLQEKDLTLKYNYDYNNVIEHLSKPDIQIIGSKTLYPEVAIDNVEPASKGLHLNYYYEFDTSPDFNSPNTWRYPQLRPYFKPDAYDRNRATSIGLTLKLHASSHRPFNKNNSKLTFPFRVTAMAQPLNFQQLGYEQFERQGALLNFGLSGFDAVEEVFKYHRQTLIWGGDSIRRAPIDTFISRTASCGHSNDLTGAMLELAGFRYRRVGGFNPIFRTVRPRGGHGAIEVYNLESRKWSYIDNFLDVIIKDVPAEKLSEVPEGQLVVSRLRRPHPKVNQFLSLADLFRYRTYADYAQRLRPTNMASLAGDEAGYGVNWELRPAVKKFNLDTDIPDEVTIYARVRYAHSNCPIKYLGYQKPCSPKTVLLSGWSSTSFKIYPKELLKRSGSEMTYYPAL